MVGDFNLNKELKQNISLEPFNPGVSKLNQFRTRDNELKPFSPGDNHLKILDLFSGTGSWINGWSKSITYNTIIHSVDIVKKDHINYHMDIRDFKPTIDYDIIYASIPCTHFSQMRQINKNKTTEKQFKEALELAELTFNYAKTANLCYVIENLQTGKLKNYYSNWQTVDYSEYGYPLRKRTAIWSNIDLKLKVKKEISYNRLFLQSLKPDEKWKIPDKLSSHIKWMIIKTFNKELKRFKK